MPIKFSNTLLRLAVDDIFFKCTVETVEQTYEMFSFSKYDMLLSQNNLHGKRLTHMHNRHRITIVIYYYIAL